MMLERYLERTEFTSYQDFHDHFAVKVPEGFNFAYDVADEYARTEPDRVALVWCDDHGQSASFTFRQMQEASDRTANLFRSLGIGKGDPVMLILKRRYEFWFCLLALHKLGAIAVPATHLLTAKDLIYRNNAADIKLVVAAADPLVLEHIDACQGLSPSLQVKVAVGGPRPGWIDFDQELGRTGAGFVRPTGAAAPANEDISLLYFTSGTTAQPKLVAHSHVSYPIGHLSTLYWIGLRPGDVHLNLSSPGWAKHAWSCLFAPWNAAATVLAYQYERFSARALLDQLVRTRVTTFCAPPTVWRMLIQEDLGRWPVALREVVGAGEPLNPEVIEQVQAAWGLTIRDGFGQTETTAVVGNSPGQAVKPGSMGRPLPGYPVVLVAPDGTVGEEGEICLDLAARPLGLMQGYLDDEARSAEAMRGGYYHTGDVASRDADGYLTYVGRMDDVFKSSDYRISPFELESVLIEHPAVAEAAVVPSPDALRLAVPKAFIVLAADAAPDAATARSIFEHLRARLSPFKRVRRLEFAPLPKTISGKIRRVELRRAEQGRDGDQPRRPGEFWEEDFPELKSGAAR